MTDAEIVKKVEEIVARWKKGAYSRQCMHSIEQAILRENPAPAPTVRVRIAVAVGNSRGWYACGSDCESDASSVEYAKDRLDTEGPHRISFVEASVPLPVPQAEAVIEGSVEEGEGQ